MVALAAFLPLHGPATAPAVYFTLPVASPLPAAGRWLAGTSPPPATPTLAAELPSAGPILPAVPPLLLTVVPLAARLSQTARLPPATYWCEAVTLSGSLPSGGVLPSGGQVPLGGPISLGSPISLGGSISLCGSTSLGGSISLGGLTALGRVISFQRFLFRLSPLLSSIAPALGRSRKWRRRWWPWLPSFPCMGRRRLQQCTSPSRLRLLYRLRGGGWLGHPLHRRLQLWRQNSPRLAQFSLLCHPSC